MGIEYKPRFFDLLVNKYSNEKTYEFNNTYWEMRKNLDYDNLPDLF